MRFFIFLFLLANMFLSDRVYAIEPAIFCDKDLRAELSPSERANMEEACSYQGNYENSLLPDQKVTSNQSFRSGQGRTYDYDGLFESLGESLKVVNAKQDCTKKNASSRVEYPTVMLKNTAVGDIPVSVIDETELNKVFSEIKKDKKYAFEALEDGCWARAEVMARDLEKKGIRVGKVFAEGYLKVVPPNSKDGEPIEWSYHVAPIVGVKTKNGIEMRVLDPALNNAPVKVKDWTDKMVSSEAYRKQLKIYTTDRFVLNPLREQSIEQVKNDSAKGRWHMAEVRLAELELESKQQQLLDRIEFEKRFSGVDK